MGSFVTKPIENAKDIDQVENEELDYNEDTLADMDISLDLNDTPNQNDYEVADVDLSQFPFSHPRVFSQMLMSLDSRSLLSLRLVCSTWVRWMNQCRVWSRALPVRREAARLAAGDQVIRNMRLDRMESQPAGTEEECRQLCIRMDRVAGEEVPPVEEGRINLVKQLHLAVDMREMDGPVMGPVEIFVRVKVDHPLVKQIVKENIVRFLNSILVDENDRRALMMWRRYPVLCTDRAMLPINFHEPMNEASDTKPEPSSKRIRLDEDLENQEVNISKVEVPARIHPDFPTLLELLDIDDPIIKRMLIQKTGIDKILACPRFTDIMSQSSSGFDSLLKVDSVQGVGMDGKVCEVNVSSLKAGDVAVMGYHVNQCFTNSEQAKNLVFWGGPDIRHNWPIFAQQLEEIDSNIERKSSPLKKVDYKPSDPVETTACMARLAARGLLVSSGKNKPVVAEPDQAEAVDDNTFYPFHSLAKSDPFSVNPVGDELYTSLAARGLSLSLAQPSTGSSRNLDESESSGSGQSDGDHPGDVIIFDRAGASTDTSGLRAMLEARGMLRIDGGRATLRIEGFEENDEDSDDSDADEDDEENDEEDTEDDEDSEEWYRNYINQRVAGAQGGISDDVMGQDPTEDDDLKEILDDSKGQDLTEDESSAEVQGGDDDLNEISAVVERGDDGSDDLMGQDEIDAVAPVRNDDSNTISDDQMVEEELTECEISNGAQRGDVSIASLDDVMVQGLTDDEISSVESVITYLS